MESTQPMPQLQQRSNKNLKVILVQLWFRTRHHVTCKSFQSQIEPPLMKCSMSTKAKPQSPTYETFVVGKNNDVVIQYRVDDMVWLISKAMGTKSAEMDGEDIAIPQAYVPTQAAYHSLISRSKPLTRVCVLPLLMAPASDWSTLLTVLKQAQHINTAVVGPDSHYT